MTDQIDIYTDGSSLGNPGPGGYGIVMRYGTLVKEFSAGYKHTTNNRMELRAVIEAIKLLNKNAVDKKIVIHTDSKYVLNAIEKGWVYNWKRKGFKDIKNPDLWLELLRIYPQYRIKFEWVKGHSGQKENEKCDQLAKKAAQGKTLKNDTGYKSNNNEATLL